MGSPDAYPRLAKPSLRLKPGSMCVSAQCSWAYLNATRTRSRIGRSTQPDFAPKSGLSVVEPNADRARERFSVPGWAIENRGTACGRPPRLWRSPAKARSLRDLTRQSIVITSARHRKLVTAWLRPWRTGRGNVPARLPAGGYQWLRIPATCSVPLARSSHRQGSLGNLLRRRCGQRTATHVNAQGRQDKGRHLPLPSLSN